MTKTHLQNITNLIKIIFLPDISHAINVTVTPAPFTVAREGENVTLSCVVSQRRRNTALPVVKWTFLPAAAERPEDEVLVARINMRKARFYGNYTKSFAWPKLKLTVVKQGKIFDLLVLNVSEGDRGLYMCRVQEFRKHQERWKAFSNCTAATELRGWWEFGSSSRQFCQGEIFPGLLCIVRSYHIKRVARYDCSFRR